MDKLKTKLLEAMKRDDFDLTDLAVLLVGEVTEVCTTVKSQQGDLMRAMSVELEQRDEIKRLENQMLELEVGNQKNLEEIENLRKIIMEMQKIGG